MTAPDVSRTVPVITLEALCPNAVEENARIDRHTLVTVTSVLRTIEPLLAKRVSGDAMMTVGDAITTGRYDARRR